MAPTITHSKYRPISTERPARGGILNILNSNPPQAIPLYPIDEVVPVPQVDDILLGLEN